MPHNSRHHGDVAIAMATPFDDSWSRPFVMIGPNANSLVNFRGPLLKALLQRGCEVTVAAPGVSGGTASAEWLEHEGIPAADLPLDRTGLNPLADMKLFLALLQLFRRERPQTMLGYTIKPVIYGTLAAWLAGVSRRYALVTGLGYAFTGEATGKRGWVQRAARLLYRLALARATGVIFQNRDDAALFAELGLLKSGVPVHVVNGSGVDLLHYRPQAIPARGAAPTFLLIARLLTAKGIREYAAAAATIKADRPDARFLLVGGHDSNPDAIPVSELDRWQTDGTLQWLGELSDVRTALAECDVFVLPSYREGTPRSVLEAMASGRAIITTDAPGCRETVIEGENGFLVPVCNSTALAAAMRRFIDDPSLAERMGQKSLEMVRLKYDVELVNKEMLKAMEIAA